LEERQLPHGIRFPHSVTLENLGELRSWVFAGEEKSWAEYSELDLLGLIGSDYTVAQVGGRQCLAYLCKLDDAALASQLISPGWW
jgi:hypothetical protein